MTIVKQYVLVCSIFKRLHIFVHRFCNNLTMCHSLYNSSCPINDITRCEYSRA